jgi:hypothetical protein
MPGQLNWTTNPGKLTYVGDGGEETLLPFKRICFMPGHVLYDSELDGIVRGYRNEDVVKIEFNKKEPT